MQTSIDASGSFYQDIGTMPKAYLQQVWGKKETTADVAAIFGECQLFVGNGKETDANVVPQNNVQSDLRWFKNLLSRATSYGVE
jgi:hypothetical protein